MSCDRVGPRVYHAEPQLWHPAGAPEGRTDISDTSHYIRIIVILKLKLHDTMTLPVDKRKISKAIEGVCKRHLSV